MKKSLIALAALAASGFAMAQSSVTLYGVVDNSVAVVKGQETVSGMIHSGNATSRLGFRGVEDLGNGLKAEFVLEGAVGSDEGTGFDFKRQSTVGLSGNFGTVRLGRELTAAYNAVSRYDMFGTVGLGATVAWSGDQTAYGVRSSNMLTYISPKFSGFGFGLNYAFGEQKENRDGRTFGTGLTYDNGPLSLGFGYDQQNNAATKDTFFAPASDVAVGSEFDLKTTSVGGSYDFGVAKLAAFYKETKYKEVGAAGSDKLKAWNLGVSAPVGAAGVVKVAYNNYKLDDLKAQQLALGYVHNLSKRTAVYGTYAILKNKDGVANFALNGAFAKAGTTDGGKQQGLQIGLRHAF